MAEPLQSFQENDVRLEIATFKTFYDFFNDLFLDLYDEYCTPYKKWSELTTSEHDRLDASLSACNYRLNDEYIYKAYANAVAAYLYFVNKNHTLLLDGNKRLSIAAALVYLGINHKWLELNWKELHDLALSIASSKASEKDNIIRSTTEFLLNKIVPYADKQSLQKYTSGSTNWIITPTVGKGDRLKGLREIFNKYFRETTYF